MIEIKLHDDAETKLSLFKDNHNGVVVQLYRAVEKRMVSGNERSLHLLWQQEVAALNDRSELKNPESFKAEVQVAIDNGNRELAKIQKYDNLIDGVLNDYGSQNRSK